MFKHILTAVTLACAASVPIASADVAYMELDGPVIERDPAGTGLFADPDQRTLRQLVDSIQAMQSRADIDGLVIRIKPGFSMGGTQIDEVGAALESLSDAGTPVHLFAESYGPAEVLLASYCDEAIMQTGGGFNSPSVYMEEMFLASAMRRVGLEPSYVQIGDYKGASEMMANSEPSEAWEENISGLLDAMYANLTTRMSDGYGLSKGDVEKALEATFWADAEIAIDAGMLDAHLDFLDLRDHLEKTYGKGFAYERDVWASRGVEVPDFASMGAFQALTTLMEMFAAENAERRTTRDTIALLYVDGAIVDGPSSQGGLFGGASVGSDTVRRALAKIERDDNIKGLVIRIDSPGGSAIASEIIWQGVRRVADAGKPVYVSVGSMAASGGYYIAVAGDKVYVSPGSIVGSIGVVGGKIAMGGLYEKLDINVVARSRGPRAGLLSSLSTWDAGERAFIRRMMTETYDLFVRRVELGRNGIDIGKTAEGRLFLGEDAIGLNMADAMGGIDVAMSDMAGALALSEGAYDVFEFPEPLSFEEMLAGAIPFAQAGHQSGHRDALGIGVALREVLGEEAWTKIGTAARAMMELRDHPVVLTSPRVLIER